MRWPQGRDRTQASAPGQRCKNSQAHCPLGQPASCRVDALADKQLPGTGKIMQNKSMRSFQFFAMSPTSTIDAKPEFLFAASVRANNKPPMHLLSLPIAVLLSHKLIHVYSRLFTNVYNGMYNMSVSTYYMYKQREKVSYCVLYSTNQYVASHVCTYMH